MKIIRVKWDIKLHATNFILIRNLYLFIVIIIIFRVRSSSWNLIKIFSFDMFSLKIKEFGKKTWYASGSKLLNVKLSYVGKHSLSLLIG